jgi:hypothetical protein
MEVSGWHHVQPTLHTIKNPGTNCIWCWAAPTAGLCVLEKRNYLPIRGFSQPSRYTNYAVHAPKLSGNSSWKYASFVRFFFWGGGGSRARVYLLVWWWLLSDYWLERCEIWCENRPWTFVHGVCEILLTRTFTETALKPSCYFRRIYNSCS